MTVLSFHPIFEAGRNRLCAGRAPDDDDLAAIRGARAVILPQGCPRALYEMARQHCRLVFPNYDARFGFPGKIGQSHLFRRSGVPHPETEAFDCIAAFHLRCGRPPRRPPRPFPFVFKVDWGGDGDTVFCAQTPDDFQRLLGLAGDYERSGQRGFLVQELVPSGSRVLRVAVIGSRLVSYWRTAAPDGPFTVNLAAGGSIDRHTDPHLIAAAEKAAAALCLRTGINLAGFDFLFRAAPPDATPLFLEINYFFGRRGLGGSEAFYRLLTAEIEAWLASAGLGAKWRRGD